MGSEGLRRGPHGARISLCRLSSNKRGTECIRKARAGNLSCGQVIVWQLGYCLFAEGLLLSRLSSKCCLELTVRPGEVVHVQPQEVDPELTQDRSQIEPRRALARRLTHLSDHHESDVKAAWETSLRSCAWPRAEAPAFWWHWKVVFKKNKRINSLEWRATLATLRWGTRHQRGQSVCHRLLSAVGMVAVHTTAICCDRRCGRDAVDLCAGCGVPRCDLRCGRGMFCHICVEPQRCPFHV